MERTKFLPTLARKRLFTGKTKNIRLLICEFGVAVLLSACYSITHSRKFLLDYLFVNKGSFYIFKNISTIYLPRKGVLDQVLTYLNEAKEFSLNTKGSILFLSGSARIPLTLLSGLPGDKLIAMARCNHCLVPAKVSIAH